MAKRVAIPYKDIKLRIVGPKEDFWAYRVQRLDFPVNLPSTTINELGNPQHAGIITDVPEVTATFQAFDVSPKIYSVMTGTDITAYPASGVNVDELSYCDMIAYVKEANVAEHLKCIHAKYMRVTDFTFNYSVDGESTEEYTLGGSNKRYFANDVIVSSGVMSAGVGDISTFTLPEVPIVLKNGDNLLSVIVDGIWVEEDQDGATSPDAEKYSLDGNVVYYNMADSAGDTVLAVYQVAADTLAWTDISNSAVPAAIRGKNIPITIGVEHQYRVQSVSIRGTFPNTKVMEMGNVNVVGYIVDPPEISGDVTVLDTDNELVALLTTGDKTGGGDTEFGVSEYDTQTLQMDIVIKDPSDNATVLKTIRIPDMRVTSEGTTSSVGGQTTQTFGFMSNEAQCIVFSGAVTI